MGLNVAHPKKLQRCAFCKKWTGDANLVFKNPISGFQFEGDSKGKCMVDNSTKSSVLGGGCKHYEPSVDASRLL